MKAADEPDRFAIFLRDSFNVLAALGRLTELEHPSIMGEIDGNLPDGPGFPAGLCVVRGGILKVWGERKIQVQPAPQMRALKMRTI